MYQRPKELVGITYKRQSGCCELYITVNDGKEVFVQCSKGGCSASLNALARVISISLQAGVDKKDIAKTLSHVVCPACIKKNADGKSCGDIIGECLLKPR